jgi:GDP/UDP-N,N'-diacetylbacillosamine 2-epimerase (hydrolysing)
MKVAVLTSSRADYGIYLPLLHAFQNDPFFDLALVVFGTHLSEEHGKTVNQIFADGFSVAECIDTMPDGDTPAHISKAMGKTITNFAALWPGKTYDLIVALGDRYEMFAACASSLPFSVPLAHIHGGETTLGAIDDAFRHSITQMATYHFAATEVYKKRVIECKGSSKHVYNVGSLSIDTLRSLSLLSIKEFLERFEIDLNIPSILVTFHPETVAFEKNEYYVDELIGALKQIKDYQIIITMPNADTMGSMIRRKLKCFISENTNTVAIESFGTLGYLSCMKYCSMMLGNTSSAFAEASFFSKYVINLGDRQKGRIIADNMRSIKIEKQEILDAVAAYKQWQAPVSENIYGNGTAAEKIVSILKSAYPA